MKKIFFILFIIFPLIGHAQKQNNKWYFGFFAGLDFNTGTPIPITTGQIGTSEGCTSIADKNTGNLLFYTDGTFVWDSTNNIMPNGNGLGGDGSSTQSALIVPQPGSNTQYYVFTVDAQAGYYNASSGGLNFSKVDMTLNGGLGDVTIHDSLLVTPTTEKLCATLACNGTDTWIVAHLWNSDAFYAYLITKNGISAPVITHTGVIHADKGSGMNNEAIGYMKFSPDGKRLALACSASMDIVQVFNFDRYTGLISNPVTDRDYSGNSPYGVSFSPDNSKLYVSCSGGGVIYQYNMMAGDSTAIIASRIKVGSTPFYLAGAFQNGPDGKMYVAKFKSFNADSLDVINNPNELGASCNYISNGLFIGNSVSQFCVFGLPNMMEKFGSSTVSMANIEPPSPSFCSGNGVRLTASGGNTYSWQPSAGLSATTGSIVIANPASTAIYTVTVHDSSGCSAIINDTVTILPAPAVSFSATVNSKIVSFTPESATGGVTSYSWDFGDTSALSNAVNPMHTYNAVRNYYVCLTVYNNSNCSFTICKYVEVLNTGLQPVTPGLNFQLYPNPAGSKLFVNNYPLLTNSIAITNVLGQTLLMQIPLPGSTQSVIDIGYLPEGVYLLEVKSNEGIMTKKFVKE